MNNYKKMYQIDVDEEVYEFLKQKAIPFKEINPNSVLRRLLLSDIHQDEIRENEIVQVFPEYPCGTPRALEQILDMIILVKNEGYNRIEATKTVADLIGVKRETIMDKYCRQLNKKVYEIDELLMSSNIDKFKELLFEKFPYHRQAINKVFNKIK
jgi:negative regulator of replication initiation